MRPLVDLLDTSRAPVLEPSHRSGAAASFEAMTESVRISHFVQGHPRGGLDAAKCEVCVDQRRGVKPRLVAGQTEVGYTTFGACRDSVPVSPRLCI